MQLIPDRSPPAVLVLDALEKLVEFVARCGAHDLLAVDVVADVGHVVVPVGGDRTDAVGGLWEREELVAAERTRSSFQVEMLPSHQFRPALTG